MNKSIQLSKSDYLLYLKHPAWLWLKKHDKAKLPEVDESTQALFDAGFLFEAYAEKIFPEGIKLTWDGYQEYLQLTIKTEEAILAGVKTLFQARFEAGEITCICDVLKFVSKDTVDLYEIKSSTGPRPYHEHDLAFQTVVLEDAGYKVRNISVIHVNKDFVRHGDIDPKEIANVTDITKNVKKRIKKTREDIEKALTVAKSPRMPDPSPTHCGMGCTAEWTDIYKALVNVQPGSIYDIYNLNATLIGKLEEMGIERAIDIPDDFDMGAKRNWQLKAIKKDKVFVENEKIKEFLSGIEYPIYFLDYETLSSVIPYFDGHKPYQQVPFQYSLHILESPGAELKHVEYLHSENSDPVKPLSESLMKNIGPKGSVIVWYEDFEKSRNKEMGEMFPEFHDFYHDLNRRMVDLIVPFSEFYYVDKRFCGSASLKYVLPVLVPELSHAELDISEGGTAQRLWMEAILDDKRPKEKEKILKDLWDYCELDTLAMVKIWEFLEKL